MTAQPAATTSNAPDSETADKMVSKITSKEDFDRALTEAGNKVILIEFFAEWCGPCKMLASKLEELALLYNDKVVIMKIDVDDLEDIAIQYNVTSMPTFLFLKNKQKIDQFVGSNSEKIATILSKVCGEPSEGKSVSTLPTETPSTTAKETSSKQKIEK